MANKPHMGSDPFQKKDPLGWIGGDQAEGSGQREGVPSSPSNSEKSKKQDEHSTQGQHSKAGSPSKHGLPHPPSNPDDPRGPSNPRKGSTTSRGLRPGWTRATFIVKEETVQQLKGVAYWDRKELKRVVEEAFRAYLRERIVKPIPSSEEVLD